MGYIPNIIFYTSILSAGIASIIGSKLFFKRPLNLFVLLVWLSFLADIVNAINSYYYLTLKIDLGIRNVGGIYRTIELVILCLFFQTLISNKKIKYLLSGVSIFIPIYYIWLKTNFFQQFGSYTEIRNLSAFLAIICSLLFFKSVITKMEVPEINKWPPFYFISSQFIYFCGVLVAFFLYKPIYKIDFFASSSLWAFHNTWLIVRNILLIIGFYYTYKTKYKWEPISLT